MKTIIIFITSLILISTLKSQAANTPFQIQNNSSACAINYSYKVYDDLTCGSCEQVSGQTVGTSSSNFIWSFNGSCTNSNQACNIEITLTLPGYGTLIVDNTWFSISPVSGPFGSCISTTGNIIWNNNTLIINP